MSVPVVLTFLVVFVAVPLNWVVAVRLWRLSLSKPNIRVLRYQALLATALAVIATIFGLVFLNNDLAKPILSGDATRLITRGAVFVWSVVPAAYWLWLYRKA
jgi:hypothetical protein